jgi:hypothetical protein
MFARRAANEGFFREGKAQVYIYGFYNQVPAAFLWLSRESHKTPFLTCGTVDQRLGRLGRTPLLSFSENVEALA